jgi:hypothetical protein
VRRPLVPILAVVLSFLAVTGTLDYSGALTPEQDRALAWVDRVLPNGAGATLHPPGAVPAGSAVFQRCRQRAESAGRLDGILQRPGRSSRARVRACA